MYKSTARSSSYLARSGNFATHGSRRGGVDIVPREPKHDWYPELFAGYYARAQYMIGLLEDEGFKFRPGTDAACAVAASECLNEGRALDAIKAMLKAMRIEEPPPEPVLLAMRAS